MDAPESFTVVRRTVPRTVVVNYVRQRDKPGPCNVVDAVYDHKSEGHEEKGDPQKEVIKQRVICVGVSWLQNELEESFSPEVRGKVIPAHIMNTENQATTGA